MSTKYRTEPLQDRNQGPELFERWARIMNKMSRSENLPFNFGSGNLLFPSEIHTLCVIGIMPGIRITDLSVRLGVTKGAVSKIVKKMEEKGLIEKYQEHGNKKEILLRLTLRGERAYLGHEEYHKKMFGRIIAEMEKLTHEQAAFLFRFLQMMEEVIDTCLLEKESIQGIEHTEEEMYGRQS
jgi:DNA-binding MarR family transcriptional regulator